MAARGSDVADYVHEVIAAFDKAVNLLRRIEDRKDARNDKEALSELYKSLALGPIIVQGYFDADSKRIGQAYKIGDYESQLQLRDVLLNLKTVVGDLSDVLLDDKVIDFRQLQEASDTCRVNAGVCLGQLSQRLSDPMRIHNLQHPPPQYMSGIPPMSPSLHYSSSRSTHSSQGGRFPRTPDPYFQQQHQLGSQWQPKRIESDEQYSVQHCRTDTETSLQKNYSNWSGISQLSTDKEIDGLSMRRPSSHCLAPEDGALLSPNLAHEHGLGQQMFPGQENLIRDSYTSLNLPTSQRSPDTPALGRQRYDPGDVSSMRQPHIEEHGPFLPDRDSTISVTSFASRAHGVNHSTLEHANEFRQPAQPAPLRLPNRPPQPQQLIRQISNHSQSGPPSKPIPAVPFDPYTGHAAIDKHTEIPIKIPSHIDGHRVPIPPRGESMVSSASSGTPQRILSPGPTFQPSAAVRRAMQNSQSRKQFNADTFSHPTQPQPQPAQALVQTLPIHKPQAAPSSQPPYPVARREQSILNARQLLQRPYPEENVTQPPQQTQQSLTQLTLQTSHPQQQQQVQPAARSQPVSTKAPSVTSVPLPSNLPLTLPTDKNTHPFCKGAFRLFLGLTKKSFIAAQRPIGMASYVPYWRCDKCMFEGQMAERPGPPDKKGRPGKPEKLFDPKIRESGAISTAVVGYDGRGEGSGGVRYKWAFLAKCHVPMKHTPDVMGRPDGTIGSFGCIFCTAEGPSRGWTHSASTLSLGLNGPGLSDAASTFSGRSSHSGAGSTGVSTPVFGNVQLFMDHLQMHRREDGWPCPEMQGRMKCVVGRVADKGEEWEVNFLPL